MTKLRGLVLVGVLGAVLFTAAPAQAEPARPAAVVVTTAHAGMALAPSQSATPNPGPVLDPAQTDKANSEKTKNKLIAGAIAVGLLGIVIWGRRIRSKRAKGS